MRNLKGALTNSKYAGMILLNSKVSIRNKINVLFIVHFCHGKYSSIFNTLFNTVLSKILLSIEHCNVLYSDWSPFLDNYPF